MAQRINTRISDRLNDWLDAKTEEMGITKSALVAIAIENYMKETEVVQWLPRVLEELEKQGINIRE